MKDENKIIIELVIPQEHITDAIGDIIEKKFAHLLPSVYENKKEEEELLTIKQMALFFQVSETSIHKWKNDGILPYIKVMSRIRFKKSEVLKLYEKRKKNFK